MKLTTEQQLAVVLGLVEQGVNAFGTLQRVGGVIKERQAEGRDVTKDDLRGSIDRSSASVDALEAAIAAA